MPLMSAEQLAILGASKGAYSPVTDTEADHDRSVTLDQTEKQVLREIYALTSFTRKGEGRRRSDSKPSHWLFRVHERDNLTAAQYQMLAIKYPKKNGNELRLYNSQAAGFEGHKGDVFIIFYREDDSEPSVAYVGQRYWEVLSANPTAQIAAVIQASSHEDQDEEYQHAIEAAAAKLPVPFIGKRYPRNPAVAWSAIVNAGFRCGLDPSHETFVSASSLHPYVEAHHLIPIYKQKDFKPHSVDVEENIIPLCPTCHRKLHLCEYETRKQLLAKLFESRQEALHRRGLEINLDDLLRSYNLS